MKITFHGAVRTVTGSQYIVEINNYRILLECGLYQGKRQVALERNRVLPFDASKINVMILSHAHIDHSGNIPNLVKSGFQGDILCTFATRDLCATMLRDSAYIQESDIAYVNKKRARKGQPPVEPAYTVADAVASLKNFLAIGYDRAYQITREITVTFKDAGHILGAAIVILDVNENGTSRRLVFTGDLGRPDRPILRDPTPIDHTDILLIESTYGNRVHQPLPEAESELAKVINRTLRRGGKIIIPSFAVGRTQELVYHLNQLKKSSTVPADLPVFVDSPLAIDATTIFRLHPECYDQETSEYLFENGDPFGFPGLEYTRSVESSKAINKLDGPAIIISASGMCEAGRIQHHLKNNIENPKNTILIVGWQAPNTLGRRIVEKTPVVRIFGEEYQLRAQVETINGFSAHADVRELLDWVGNINDPPTHTFVIHGEENQSLSFAKELERRGHKNVVVPQLHQSFTL
ncbi:MAG: MBL fold metallo-hydrolase [Chloroflexota bacterium]